MKKLLFTFFILLIVALPARSQPGQDKQVTLHGKKYYEHIVKKKETVYGVSKDFNLSPKNLILENPKAIDGILPGDTLYIPLMVPGPVSTGLPKDSVNYIYHKVEPKETLYSLTKQYGVSTSTLDSLNPDLKDKGLKAGMVLRIPNRNSPIVSKNTTTQGKRDTTKEKQAYKNLVQQQGGSNATQITTKVAGKLLNRYNVALMLPFMPQEVDSIKMNRLLDGVQQFPLMAQISGDFYNGVHIALDSLAMQGLDVNLHVYNIPTDSTSNKIDSLLKLPEMATMNLIVGPAYPSHFKQVAKYAMQHQIPIVSPLSAENSVLRDNPYASKAVPSPSTETEQMADYIAANKHAENIIILHNRDALNDNYYEVFKKRLNTSLSIIDKSDSAIVATYSDELGDLGKKLSDRKNNIIVVPYQGSSFVIKFLNQFANSKYPNNDSIEIYGMHSWTNMDVMNLEYLDTLHFHFPSNEFTDYSNHATIRFIQKYRAMYYTEPSTYAYQGFDETYFYVSMLKKYGTALQDNLVGEKYNGVHTAFDLYRPGDKDGLENKAVYILEYKGFNLVKDK